MQFIVVWACAASAPSTASDDIWSYFKAEKRAGPDRRAYEIWAGGDGTHRYASIWTGLTWAPLGAIDQDGIRLRAVTGAGRYTYEGWRLVGGLPAPARFTGISMFADALVGYHLQWGALTLKPFAGVAMAEHWTLPSDPISRINGRSVGAKLVLESWLRMGPALWANVDASWSQVHETVNVRARLGYRLLDDFSVGAEASALSDVDQDLRRAGLFVRYAWSWGEMSIGGGVTGTSWDDAARSARPYAAATLLGKF